MDTSEKSKAIVRRGGARPGAGRKRGTPYRSSMQGAKSLRERFPIFPLEYMLTVLNDVDEPTAFRADMARAAAPYIHPRLAAVEISDLNKVQTRQTIDVTKLTDDELAFLERVIMKSQTTTVIDDDPQDAPMIEFDDSGYKY